MNLLEAAALGFTQRCYTLRSDINSVKDELDKPPIYLALEQGFAVLAQRMWEEWDARLDFCTQIGWTLVHLMAQTNNYQFFEAVMAKNGFSRELLNTRDVIGTTPLMLATQQGSLGMITCLLKYGVEINLRDDNNQQAIDFALDASYIPLFSAAEKPDSLTANRNAALPLKFDVLKP